MREERIALHVCDAIAEVTSGDRIGVFAMQQAEGGCPPFRLPQWADRARRSPRDIGEGGGLHPLYGC
jgi:hypothetical protein